MKKLLCLFVCTVVPALAQRFDRPKFERLAMTPPMGWNTWNTFASDISETLVEGTADSMIASGMRDAGYVYIVLDDTWSAKDRNAAGDLVADPVKFPHGMKALGDYLHARGFKFGIYNCAGATTCAGFPGGRGHEFQDARLYASWGVDYLKYDWCDHGTANGPESYHIMSDALRAAGRPVVFSLCEWGQNQPWLWAEPVGHLWRTTGDIYASYDGVNKWSSGWKINLDKQVGLEKYAGPGHWNDPDMLEVGNKGLTPAESRAHFSFWCLLAAPLIAGNDVRSMTPEVRDILTNREAIAVDQDSLGHQGFRFLVDGKGHREIWAKELSGGAWAVCVLNTGPEAATLTVNWPELTFLTAQYYTVRDLWSKRDVGTAPTPYTARVDSHGAMFLRLTPSGG